MTQDELDRLEALANAATSGPWCVWDGPQYVGGGEDLCIGAGKKWLANMDHRFCASIRDATFGPRECDPDTMTCDICTIDAGKITEEERANAAFIAAARDAVPALVAEVRRLQSEAGAIEVLRSHGWNHRLHVSFNDDRQTLEKPPTQKSLASVIEREMGERITPLPMIGSDEHMISLIAEVRRLRALAPSVAHASSGELVGAANALNDALVDGETLEECCRRVIVAWWDVDADKDA